MKFDFFFKQFIQLYIFDLFIPLLDRAVWLSAAGHQHKVFFFVSFFLSLDQNLKMQPKQPQNLCTLLGVATNLQAYLSG